MEKTKYKCLLFDADDTLVDFAKDAERAFRKALCAIGRETEETVRACVEFDYGNWDKIGLANTHLPDVQENFHEMYVRHVREIFAHAEDAHGLNGRAEEAERVFFGAFAEPAHPLGGSLRVVGELSKRYRVFAATNGIAALQRGRLAQFPLEGVFVSEELGVIKPNPLYFERVLEKIPARREECLMVGDSLRTDVRGANAAGIDCIWLNPQGLPRPADVSVAAEIGDLSELLQIL